MLSELSKQRDRTFYVGHPDASARDSGDLDVPEVQRPNMAVT